MGIYWAEPIADITSATTATILFLIFFKRMLSADYLKNFFKQGKRFLITQKGARVPSRENSQMGAGHLFATDSDCDPPHTG